MNYIMKGRKSRFSDTLMTLFMLIMFVFSANVGFSQWSFIPQERAIGCEGSGGYVVQYNSQLLAEFRTVGIPTQAQCEQIRSQILAIRVGGEGCTVYFECTPCTGSDMNLSNDPYASGMESTPSSNMIGPEIGGPNFTPTSMESINMWIQDWQRKNASLNNAVDITNLITGDRSFDDAYTKEMDKIVTEKRPPKVERDASADYVWGVVDPNYLKQWDPDKIGKTAVSGRGVKQVVPEAQVDPVEAATQSSLGSKVPMPEGGTKEMSAHPKIDAVTSLLKDAASLIGEVKGVGVGAQILLNANINLYSELSKAYDDGINQGKSISTMEILTNAYNNTVSDVSSAAKEMITDGVVKGTTGMITKYGVTGALKLAGRTVSEETTKQATSLVSNAVDFIDDPLQTTVKAGAGAGGSRLTKTDVDGGVVVKTFNLGKNIGDTGKLLLSE